MLSITDFSKAFSVVVYFIDKARQFSGCMDYFFVLFLMFTSQTFDRNFVLYIIKCDSNAASVRSAWK